MHTTLWTLFSVNMIRDLSACNSTNSVLSACVSTSPAHLGLGALVCCMARGGGRCSWNICPSSPPPPPWPPAAAPRWPTAARTDPRLSPSPCGGAGKEQEQEQEQEGMCVHTECLGRPCLCCSISVRTACLALSRGPEMVSCSLMLLGQMS